MKHDVVTREDWLDARKSLLAREKELTRLRDAVSAERRALPWVEVEKAYLFDGPQGKVGLAGLFGGNSQLIVHHFMFDPEWDEGCKSCSLEADHAEGAYVHLVNHDVSYVRVSRAPLEKIEAYKRRIGWTTPWVSSHGSDFNYDFHVSFTDEELKDGRFYYNYREETEDYGVRELPGLSVFYKDDAGTVLHTYSSYARGNEEVIGAFIYLDITPKGRNETAIMDWVRRHDEYGAQPAAACCGG